MQVGNQLLGKIQQFIEQEGRKPTPDAPLSVRVQAGTTKVEAQVSAFDSLGVAFRTLEISRENPQTSLEAIAQTASDRITYLWEPLALLERDLDRERIQLRSSPPYVDSEAIAFYEARLSRQNGRVHVQMTRYRQVKGQKRRAQIPVTLTHEAFQRLVNDLDLALSTSETE